MNNDSQSTSFQPHTEVPSRSEDRSQNLETASTQQQEDVDIEEFLVEEVKAYPCIWNTKASSYKDNMKKIQAWKNISEKLETEGQCYYMCV